MTSPLISSLAMDCSKYTAFNGIFEMCIFKQIECWRTYWLHGGWKLTAEIENWCEGQYTNTTAPAADDIQTRVLCDGTFTTKFNVTSSFRNEPGSSIRLDYQCGIAFSSVTNKDLGRHGEPGLNFYQNTFCNGTEISELEVTAPGDDSVFTQLFEMGGGFLTTDVGSCESAAYILNSVDIFGVFYSYMIIPECDPNAAIARHFKQEVLPVTINCNGVLQNATDSCSGLLLAFSQMDHGTASCKCRGDYIVSVNRNNYHEFNCTGESYGEQMRRGGRKTFVRSSICVGEQSYIPFHGMKSEQRFFEGSKSVCYGAAVKSTIFGPPPF